MKSAHSDCPCFENVQLPISVICFLSKSLLTSMLTVPPSPTKQAFPHVLSYLIDCDLADGEEDASKEQ